MGDNRHHRRPSHSQAAWPVAILIAAAALSGCSLIHKVQTAVHTAKGNLDTINSFDASMTSKVPPNFQVTYQTSGSSPATVVYAVEAPKELAFTVTPTSGSTDAVHLVANATGEYACTPPSAGGSSGASSWTCDKLDASTATAQSSLYGIYTPQHWVALIKGLGIAAGVAGDKVSTSTMTANGFKMSCLDLVATGTPGTSTICTTSQGLLGYAKAAGDSTSFTITAYSGSPSSSVFQLPAGAKIVDVTPTTNSGSTSTT